MSKNVKVIFDRKNQVSKTGTGKIDIRIYLKDGERKFETVGHATLEDSEAAMQSKNIVAKVKHYEQIINAMKLLNEEMTIENFNKHIYTAQAPSKPEEDFYLKVTTFVSHLLTGALNALKTKASPRIPSRIIK